MKFAALLFALLVFTFACQKHSPVLNQTRTIEPTKTPKLAEILSPEIKKLLESAVE